MTASDEQGDSTPRLPYAKESGETAERIRKRRGGGLRHSTACSCTAHQWRTAGTLGAIREQSTLPPDIRELAILRVAALNGADYEWNAPVARRRGLTDAQLDALRDGADPGPFTDVQRATLAYTDAMTQEVQVAQPLFDELGRHFDERQVVELTATVGAYNLVSRFLVASRIEPSG